MTSTRTTIALKTVLFVVSEDWYFVSHRMEIAIEALKHGYKVTVFCNVTHMQQKIEDAGIKVIDWSLNRRSKNPFQEFSSIARLKACILAERPDIIHAVALKPVIYSFICLKLLGFKTRMIAALGGLGFIYSSKNLSAALLRPVINKIVAALLNRPNTHILLQNPDDLALLTQAGLKPRPDNPSIIRGVGVRTDIFKPAADYPNDRIIISLPARMLWDKGVREFVEVAKRVRQTHPDVGFSLAGMRDEHNPECIPLEQLQHWESTHNVLWLGHQEDMPGYLRSVSIVLFPSYREGFPKALLEAASSGLPIVAFDVPGCREIVTNNKNGFLVPFADLEQLSARTLQLIEEKDLRQRFGNAGRQQVLEAFSVATIAQQTFKLWEGKA